MAWVQTVAVDAASGKLQQMYERVRQRAGVVSNIATLQSLRPKTMERGLRSLLSDHGRSQRHQQTGAGADRNSRLKDKRLRVLNGIARERPPVGGR